MEFTVRRSASAWLTVALLAGCGAAGPHNDAPEARPVSLVVERIGGCAEPDRGGCGEPVTVDPVADVDREAAAVLATADLEQLREIDPGPNGCGDAFVDGIGTFVTVRREAGPNLPAFEEVTFCLTDAPDLPAVAAIRTVLDAVGADTDD